MSQTGLSQRWSREALEARVVRYRDLRPCYNAFIDTRTPGSEAKENFTIIGPGVSENPEQYVHIAEPHGFNIGGARQPPGCVNSQHSHDTAETFVVHTGRWRFDLGEHGDDARVEIGPGDVISIPTRTFRGFTNIGQGSEPGYLFAILGQDNPGRVTWAPQVFDLAREHGLVLLESGRLIDTTKGETVPAGARPMPATDPQQVAALRRYRQDEAEQLVVRADSDATLIIGDGAPLDWPHGYTLERHLLDGTAGFDAAGAVLFVHAGSVAVEADGERVELGEGDVMTVPADLTSLRCSGNSATLFAIRRS